VADFTALARQLELEKVEWLVATVCLRASQLVLISCAVLNLVWHQKLHLALALNCFVVLLFLIDLLMEHLIVEADNAQPENVIGDFVELLGELVEDSRAALAVESAAIVVHELHFLLPLQFVQVQCLGLLVLSGISGSLLADHDITHVLARSFCPIRTLNTITVASFPVIATFQIVELLFGLLDLALLLNGLACLRDADLAVATNQARLSAALPRCTIGEVVLGLGVFINKAFLLHACLVVAAV